MKKAFVITLSALAVIIIGIYVAGVIIGKDIFLPHTSVNGQDVSYKHAPEVDIMLQPQAEDFERIAEE